jgi:hypothetical protein
LYFLVCGGWTPLWFFCIFGFAPAPQTSIQKTQSGVQPSHCKIP